MAYSISKIIVQKKKYIFYIVMVVFILVSITTSVIGSYAIYQYDTTKKNFLDNRFAKIIEISSYSSKTNESRKLNSNDIKQVRDLLTNLNVKSKIIVEYQINFGIQTNTDDVLFVKSFSKNFFVDNILEENVMITKNSFKSKKIVLNIPVIKLEKSGYKSDDLIKKKYNIFKVDNSSVLNKYIKSDEVIVSRKMFREITKIMFPQKKYVDIEKIYVNIDSIDKIKTVANLLDSNHYNINHAFEYYDDLDISVDKLAKFSLVVMILLLIFVVFLLIGLFEIMLKNSVGDIAILKHLGYEKIEINKIYLYPMILKIIFSIIVILISNGILYKLKVINNINEIIVFTIVNIILGILSLIVMFYRIDFYSNKNVLDLIKKCKVEE